MSEKMKALEELAKAMDKMKADKFKSRKGKPAEEVCEDEEGCEEPEMEVEVVELEDGEEPAEESEDEEDKPKSFSQILADVAKRKGKKH